MITGLRPALVDLLPVDGPTYVYDLTALDSHAARVRTALNGIEIHYAVKANPDAAVISTLRPHVDGFEVGSAGEFDHVRTLLPDVPISFGGPGKSEHDLSRAVHATRVNVESLTELDRIIALGRPVDVMLRRNLPIQVDGAALTMDGPFGMDAEDADQAMAILDGTAARAAGVRYRGVHTHLASGLGANTLLSIADHVVDLADDMSHLGGDEVCLGGGMAVAYDEPDALFDWERYGKGLRAVNPPAHGRVLRLEPGRALVVYCGWYVTRVLDIKTVREQQYAIVAGGTHHLRTPATKGHDHPCAVVPTGTGPRLDPAYGPVTVVGQLCTPKDVLTGQAPAPVATGDTVAFAMAGAYAWNISHHDFLLHPPPDIRYLR